MPTLTVQNQTVPNDGAVFMSLQRTLTVSQKFEASVSQIKSYGSTPLHGQAVDKLYNGTYGRTHSLSEENLPQTDTK